MAGIRQLRPNLLELLEADLETAEPVPLAEDDEPGLAITAERSESFAAEVAQRHAPAPAAQGPSLQSGADLSEASLIEARPRRRRDRRE
jgi:hypothetical protein